jgi:hypothetical protein
VVLIVGSRRLGEQDREGLAGEETSPRQPQPSTTQLHRATLSAVSWNSQGICFLDERELAVLFLESMPRAGPKLRQFRSTGDSTCNSSLKGDIFS